MTNRTPKEIYEADAAAYVPCEACGGAGHAPDNIACRYCEGASVVRMGGREKQHWLAYGGDEEALLSYGFPVSCPYTSCEAIPGSHCVNARDGQPMPHGHRDRKVEWAAIKRDLPRWLSGLHPLGQVAAALFAAQAAFEVWADVDDVDYRGPNVKAVLDACAAYVRNPTAARQDQCQIPPQSGLPEWAWSLSREIVHGAASGGMHGAYLGDVFKAAAELVGEEKILAAAFEGALSWARGAP